jgi:hypothetical protein
MILPDATPDDLTSHPLRMEALRLQEAGDGFSVWHGHDTTSGQDLEFLLNLENRTGYLAREGGTVLAGRLLEDGPHVTLVFSNPAFGQVKVDLNAEELELNAERIGVEYAPGEDPKLRLYDKLTQDTLLETSGDSLHELVDEHALDPKDYPGSGLQYLKKLGLL